MRAACAQRGLTDVIIPKRAATGRQAKKPVPLGLRWPLERTNSWLSNFGQLRRTTDRHSHRRSAQLALAIVVLLTAKRVDWRDRWSPIR